MLTVKNYRDNAVYHHNQQYDSQSSRPCGAAESNYLSDYKSSYRQYSSSSRMQIVPLACAEERHHNPQLPKIQRRTTYQDTYYIPWKSDMNKLCSVKKPKHEKVMISSRQTCTQQTYQQPCLTDRLRAPTTRYGSSPIGTKPAQGTLPTLTHKADMSSRRHTQYTVNYGSSASDFHLPKLDDCTNSLTGLDSSEFTRKVRFRRKSNKDHESGWAGPC